MIWKNIKLNDIIILFYFLEDSLSGEINPQFECYPFGIDWKKMIEESHQPASHEHN